MTAVLVTLLHLVVTAAKLCGPGGVRAVIVENLLLKQQLIVLRRPRQRAPNLTSTERVLCGLEAIFLGPGRIYKVAIGVRPATLHGVSPGTGAPEVPLPVLVESASEEARVDLTEGGLPF